MPDGTNTLAPKAEVERATLVELINAAVDAHAAFGEVVTRLDRLEPEPDDHENAEWQAANDAEEAALAAVIAYGPTSWTEHASKTTWLSAFIDKHDAENRVRALDAVADDAGRLHMLACTTSAAWTASLEAFRQSYATMKAAEGAYNADPDADDDHPLCKAHDDAVSEWCAARDALARTPVSNPQDFAVKFENLWGDATESYTDDETSDPRWVAGLLAEPTMELAYPTNLFQDALRLAGRGDDPRSTTGPFNTDFMLAAFRAIMGEIPPGAFDDHRAVRSVGDARRDAAAQEAWSKLTFRERDLLQAALKKEPCKAAERWVAKWEEAGGAVGYWQGEIWLGQPAFRSGAVVCSGPVDCPPPRAHSSRDLDATFDAMRAELADKALAAEVTRIARRKPPLMTLVPEADQ